MRTSLRLCVAFGAAVLTTLAMAGAALAAPPANDDFANPQVISALAPYEGSNVDSTTETTTSPTESQRLQSLTGWGIFNTTWHSWESPGNGDVTFVVCSSFATNVILTTGSSVDTVVTPSMIIGNPSRQGTSLAGPAHPSGCASNEYVAELGTASVQAGSILRPVVSSAFNGSTGSYRITTIYSDAPANDAFANRIELYSRHTTSGTNVAATTEANEANNPYANYRTVWYEYEAPGTSTINVELCSTFAANLVVYSGSSLPLTPMQSAQGPTVDTCGTGKYLTQINAVPVTGGTVVKIQVGGYNGQEFVGTFDITAEYNGAPPNDDWFTATDLGTSTSALVFGDNTNSTVGAPQINAMDAEESVWYKWTAPADATVVVDACAGSASSYDGHLAVFDSALATPLVSGDLTQQGADDDGCDGDRDLMPKLSFGATAGKTYWIVFSLDPTASGPLYTEFTLLLATSPSNVTLPTIDGADNYVGTEYTIDPGAWVGFSPITYSYQWQRCDDTGDNCLDISGETSLTYTLAAADSGNTVRALVTATNLGGSTQESTGTSAVIEDDPDADDDGYLDVEDDCPNNANEDPKTNGCPVEALTNTVAPQVTGFANYGETLSVSNGTWTYPDVDPGVDAPTFSYQWQLCVMDANTCAPISGANGSTYTIGIDDVGQFLNVIVTATNADGSSTAESNLVGPVSDPPDSDGDGVFDPVDECINHIGDPSKSNGCPIENVSITANPTISGAQTVGTQLTVTSAGTAQNDPGVDIGVDAPSALIFWRSCTSPTLTGTCEVRDGSTLGVGSTYTVTTSDIGRFIRVVAVWTNNEGLDVSAYSVAGAAVTMPTPPPTNPPAPPAPTDPLTLAVKKSLGTVKRDKKGVATLKGAIVTCGAASTGACAGTVAISGKVGKKTVKFGNVKISAAAGTTGPVKFKPSSKLAKAIKKAKKLKVTLVFNVSAPGFTAQTATATATLR